MDWSAISIVIATVMGPILAVQAQKYLERQRAQKRAKDTIFRTLVATRATRLSISVSTHGSCGSVGCLTILHHDPRHPITSTTRPPSITSIRQRIYSALSAFFAMT